jgi:PilZ domain
MAQPDRRRYPRARTQIVYRPAGLAWFHHRRSTVDIGLGGMRSLTDDHLAVGRRLELELMAADGGWVRCWVRIAWLDRLPEGAPALYEIGMEFLDMEQADLHRVAGVLQAAD